MWREAISPTSPPTPPTSPARSSPKPTNSKLIGLVPGETNQVTLTITGQWGKTRQIVTFTVDMPDTSSGYSTRLEVE